MPTTQQPRWKFIANLGDASPLDHGGYFIYKDDVGFLTEEAQVILPFTDYDEGDTETYTIYRIVLDQLKLVDGYLVSKSYSPDWGRLAQPRTRRGVLEWRPDAAAPEPHAKRYAEWFQEDLGRVAKLVDRSTEELTSMFMSEDPIQRALGYEALGAYYGWHEFDSYPLNLTRKETEKRFAKELKAIKAGKV